MEGRQANVLCRLLVVVFCAAVAQCDSGCVERFGTCKYTSEGCSGGSFTSGLCNGPVNRQCCVPNYSSADSLCRNRGGTCQRTTVSCVGGYQSGLCGGPVDRRCCLPTPTGTGGTSSGGSCSFEVKNLACELANSANVVAATVHPSGKTDNAYARNNLVDVCNGGKAARSRYTCPECQTTGAPGGSTCLSRNMLRYLVDLKNKGKVKINEIAGACHSCQSRHYSGLAVDLNRIEPGTNRDRTQEYLTKCVQFGGTVLDEGSHIHCQFTDGTHPNW